MTSTYTASVSQTQGRSGYSIIFRHPVRRDHTTGKPGVRVRRGLGTRDKGEAERLRDELNELLANHRYHDLATRAEAERRFDARVVDIFFDRMVPEEYDFSALRDSAIPLPPSDDPDGYRHVLLLGTTGAGKTTLVRQLISTDPSTERFPSTSTSKTTIHDTEIILDDGPWRGVATFAPSDEVREHLMECIARAVLAAVADSDDPTVLRFLLNHVDQRYRFGYVLGTGLHSATRVPDFDDDDDDDQDADPQEDSEAAASELSTIDMDATNEVLRRSVNQVKQIADQLRDHLYAELDPAEDEKDKRALEDLLEEHLDNLLRDHETFHEITDALIDQIEKRFDLLPPGKVTKTRQGWPLTWQGEWPVEERTEFLNAVSRFSSNHAPRYGYLLTPLVNGLRVAGPFSPTWADGQRPKLVLLDGEGMGHTPKSSSSVSTSVSRRIEAADAVLLVDNATQPMQAASLAAMREIVATGHGSKLILVFTHFDEVTGDNLPRVSDRAQHVLASVEGVMVEFGKDLGPYAERILRKRATEARFFLANIQEDLLKYEKANTRTIKQLRKLLHAIAKVIERPPPGAATPTYDRMNLTLAIHSAARAFHEAWRPRLGLEVKRGFEKEPWQSLKAMNRRLATMGKDEYRHLRPVADLKLWLRDQLYTFIQSPLRWEGPEPSDEEKQLTYDNLADNLGRRLLSLSTRRVWKDPIRDWERAYAESGRGSTYARARIIGNDIYESAAPVPDVTPTPDRNQFLREVVAEVEAAAEEVGATLV